MLKIVLSPLFGWFLVACFVAIVVTDSHTAVAICYGIGDLLVGLAHLVSNAAHALVAFANEFQQPTTGGQS